MKIPPKVASTKSVRLDQAFERYYPSMFRYFRYRGADADTANDLASSTFERALKALNRYDLNARDGSAVLLCGNFSF